MKRKSTSKNNGYSVPQLSYDCRRKIHRSQTVASHLHFYLLASDSDTIRVWLPYVLSYIADDIEDIDNELLELGLFDKSIGIAPDELPDTRNKKLRKVMK